MNDGVQHRGGARSVELSPRQREILALVSAGMTAGEIARELGIAPRTVRMHCDALRMKLGVSKRRLIPGAYRALTGDDPLALRTRTARRATNPGDGARWAVSLRAVLPGLRGRATLKWLRLPSEVTLA